MSNPVKPHPEAYEDFKVGDRVFCLAWTGMPFEVAVKDDQARRISLVGVGPCSLSEGARLDIDPSAMFMLSHNLWDTIWHWPDRAGESYKQVVRHYIDEHQDGSLGAQRVPDAAAARASFLSLGLDVRPGPPQLGRFCSVSRVGLLRPSKAACSVTRLEPANSTSGRVAA